jgi:hypothetical protein
MHDLHLHMPTYLASFAVVLLSGLLAHQFYTWYRLSHIPGPFWAQFSKYWMVSQSLKGQMHSSFKEATDKYGQLFERLLRLENLENLC